MSYCHTQRSPLHLLLAALGLILLAVAWTSGDNAGELAALLAVGGMFLFLALCFASLTVRDEGDSLVVRYGPLPVFGRRLRYRDIEQVRAMRSSLVDGWGIHYFPGRGWTYNLWGFDCVELTVAGKTIRIGSDDVPQLVQFLHTRKTINKATDRFV